ncbi:MAG: STAS domain-containing protein [Rhodobacteraceae bacterium]|nr:MAG: STAS domain-containing protein [Paracoccaceae bacterium]
MKLDGPPRRGDEMPDIQLPEILDQRAAQKVATLLIEEIGKPIKLDASAITRLGTIGVEMLLAAQRQWQSDGVAFEVCDWSANAEKAIATLGLSTTQFQVEVQS